MKLRFSLSTCRASTLTDVLIVIVTVFLLAALFLPMLAKSKSRASRINCVSNLKQVGLGFRMWSNDHNDLFPWYVQTTNGGTKVGETFASEVSANFMVCSNEISSPKILACSYDAGRSKARQFGGTAAEGGFSKANLSYFIGREADETLPQSVLCGDRNIQKSKSDPTAADPSLLAFNNSPTNNTDARWKGTIHVRYGNLCLGDGSVLQATDALLQRQLTSANTNGVPVMTLHFPTPP